MFEEAGDDESTSDRSGAGGVDSALADSERRYNLLVDSMRDYAIYMLDARGIVTSWTRPAESITGYASGEIIGQHYRVLFTPDERGRGVPEQELEEARRDGRLTREGWRSRRDGSCFWSEEITTAIVDSAGAVQGYSKIARDGTERMVAAAERERLLYQANETNRIKDEFLSTVSHELRTPLNAILGWAQLVRKGRMTPDATLKALEVIERNARTQAALIDDLLDTSRVMSGQIRLDRQPTSPVAAVMAAVETIRPAAESKRVDVQVHADPAESIGNVLADTARLQQVIWNLLANAVKFTPECGQVRVTVASQDGRAEIAVTDTGVGIDAAFLPYVFDRFSQADSSTTRTQPGLGLGLAIVKHLVDLHNGEIAVESPGLRHGATFRVTLPLMACGESVRRGGAAMPASDGAGHQPPTMECLRGACVIVVDDDKDARELIDAALHAYGVTVMPAASVGEGLGLVERHAPQLVLVDLAMPGEDGFAFIRRLRSHAESRVRDIPAVAVTAHVRDRDRERLLNAGYQAHLPKPLELHDLVATAATLIGGYGSFIHPCTTA